MYYKLESIVVFLKFISNLLLLRNFGKIIEMILKTEVAHVNVMTPW